MRPLLILALLSTAAAHAARSSRPIPALRRAPKVNGALGDLSPAVTLKGGRGFGARVAYQRTTVYVGLTARSRDVDEKDRFEVSLHFPEAGVSAPGYVFQLTPDGAVTPAEDSNTPTFAARQVRAAVVHGKHTFSAELAVPITAFPRFPLKEAMTLDLCVTFRDVGDASTRSTSNCENGSMPEPLRVPDEVRRAIDVKPPQDIATLEPGDGGWLGYGVLFYPRWVQADEHIDLRTLNRLLPTEAVDPKAVGVGLPRQLNLPHGGELLSVLSGEDPYEQAGKCDGDRELRLGLFLVHGKSAERVLDFPAATCALGRATSVVLDEQGALTIRYTNGATMHFTWTGDHFEQTQIG